MMLQVLYAAEPSVELSTVLQLHIGRILNNTYVHYVSIVSYFFQFIRIMVAIQLEVDPVFFFTRVYWILTYKVYYTYNTHDG